MGAMQDPSLAKMKERFGDTLTLRYILCDVLVQHVQVFWLAHEYLKKRLGRSRRKLETRLCR